MTTELYVGNLSTKTTEDQIRTLFAPAGEITEVIVMLDEVTGRSKGFGYVNMDTFMQAKTAIERFNGQTLDSNKLTVKYAGQQSEKLLKGSQGGSLRNQRQGGRAKYRGGAGTL